jgi:Mg/Co/Ni transporter MgtE
VSGSIWRRTTDHGRQTTFTKNNGILPVLAARLRIDPTVVSGPVMSTLVYATGLFIYFTIAGILLSL